MARTEIRANKCGINPYMPVAYRPILSHLQTASGRDAVRDATAFDAKMSLYRHPLVGATSSVVRPGR